MAAWEVVSDKVIERVALYKSRPTWQRLDTLPFAVAYGVLHAWTLVRLGNTRSTTRCSNHNKMTGPKSTHIAFPGVCCYDV